MPIISESDQDAIWNLVAEGVAETPEISVRYMPHLMKEIMQDAGIPPTSAEKLMYNPAAVAQIEQDLNEVCWRWLVENLKPRYSKFLGSPSQPPQNPKAHPKPWESQMSAG